MTKIRIIITFLIGLFLTQSCLHEQENIFDMSTSERLNEAQKYYEKILTDAENGWILEYITGDTDANRRGGFNFLLKFDGGNVTASIDALAMSDVDPTNPNPYEQKTSLYRFDQDMSVTISFSSYNSFLHYYHEQHGSYTTYKGDFEFTIMEANEDLVILRGKKYGNIMEMRRIPLDVSWESYLKDINDIIDICSVYSQFELTKNDQVIGSGSLNSNFRYTFQINSDEVSSNAIFTTEGIKFIEPLSIDNKEYIHFRWDNEAKVYNSIENNGDLKILPLLDPSYLYYEDYIGEYILKYNNTRTTTATISEKVKGKTLTLNGLTNFPIELIFDKMAGTVSLTTQDIGKSQGFTVVLCPWDTNAGYLTWGLGVGLVSVPNLLKLEEGNIEFSFIDNGVWGSYPANGFLLRLYNSVLGSHGSDTYQGNYTEGDRQFYNFILTKN